MDKTLKIKKENIFFQKAWMLLWRHWQNYYPSYIYKDSKTLPEFSDQQQVVKNLHRPMKLVGLEMVQHFEKFEMKYCCANKLGK